MMAAEGSGGQDALTLGGLTIACPKQAPAPFKVQSAGTSKAIWRYSMVCQSLGLDAGPDAAPVGAVVGEGDRAVTD